MKEEKHLEILKEVLDEIETSLKDKRGLLIHQRRLAFSLSLGAVNLLELYLHRINIIKEGAKIDHRWFKRKEERILEQLENQIIVSIDDVDKMKEIIEIISKIEEKRDDIAYGAPSTENLLQEKINLFFKLKKIVNL